MLSTKEHCDVSWAHSAMTITYKCLKRKGGLNNGPNKNLILFHFKSSAFHYSQKNYISMCTIIHLFHRSPL